MASVLLWTRSIAVGPKDGPAGNAHGSASNGGSYRGDRGTTRHGNSSISRLGGPWPLTEPVPPAAMAVPGIRYQTAGAHQSTVDEKAPAKRPSRTVAVRVGRRPPRDP